MGLEPPPGSETTLPADTSVEILARINQREQEIERALLEAREAAAAIIQEARLKAEAVASSRREQLEREAAASAEAIVAAARVEAGEILAVGAREAAAILGTPRERIEDAAQRCLSLVLPAGAVGDAR